MRAKSGGDGRRALFFFFTLLLAVVVGRDFTLGLRPGQPNTIFATGYLNGSRSTVAAAFLSAPVLFAACWAVARRLGRRVAGRTKLACAVWVVALPYLFVVSTNICFDRSPAELHTGRIESSSDEYHQGARGERGDWTAYVVFESWDGSGPAALEVKSVPTRADRAPAEIDLWVHRGFWRIPWVESCRFRSARGVESRCGFSGARFLPWWGDR